MSASVITRRVAIFTVFLSTAWVVATAAASALVPDPPGSGPQAPTHPAPAATAGGGMDLTHWLLTAVAVVVVVMLAAGLAKALHHRHLHAPTRTAH